MADFVDDEAVLSSNDDDSSAGSLTDEGELPGSSTGKRVKTTKRKSKSAKKRRVVSSDEDEDDEDDDEKAKEEMKDFIADDVEEDGNDDKDSDNSDGKSDDGNLDEDDLELINDNLGLDASTSRTKRAHISDSEDEAEDERRAIGKELFDGDDEDPSSASANRRQRSPPPSDDDRRSVSDRSDESDEDNFIVRTGEDERPGAHRRRKNRDRSRPHVNADALEEARDIFGVDDFNFDDFQNGGGEGGREPDEEDDEDDEEEEDEEFLDEDEDGEDGERRRIRRVRRRRRERKARLLDQLDPDEIERGYLRDQDQRIQLEDKPERFMTRSQPVTEPADDTELKHEANWIQTHALSRTRLLSRPPRSLRSQPDDAKQLDAIRAVLGCLRKDMFEVPFIAFYRKELVGTTLDMQDLWAIYKGDEKYCALQQRRLKLQELMRRMHSYLAENSTAAIVERRPLTDDDLARTDEIQTADQLDDHVAHFNLYYGPELPKMSEWERHIRESKLADIGDEAALAELAELNASRKFRQSTRSDRYQLCVDCGIAGMAARLGLSADQFADNLVWLKHHVVQDPSMPEEIADQYVSPSFPTAEDVCQGAVWMLAREISRHPKVRDHVRLALRRSVRLNVRTTKKGREDIDEQHPLFNKRYIKEKPVRDLEGADFLYYHKAKEAGQLEVELVPCKAEEKVLQQTLVDHILREQPFHRDEYTELATAWNELRRQCVVMAINEMTIPVILEQFRKQLLDEAIECVVKKCGTEMAERLRRTGFRPDLRDLEEAAAKDDEAVDVRALRIAALAYGTERDEAAFCVLVDQNGEVVDHVRLQHLTRFGGAANDRQLQAEDLATLRQWAKRRRPHAIMIAAEDTQATRLADQLNRMLDESYRSGELSFKSSAYVMDNAPAKVYMRSRKAQADHPDWPALLSQALALARLSVEPLAEYAGLCNSDDDILNLPLHPLQRDVPIELLRAALEQELVNRVNECGVDVNRCCEHAWWAPVLACVGGLGPRKAALFTRSVQKKLTAGLVTNRTELVTALEMGPRVFINCAGFVRIDTKYIAERLDAVAQDAYVEVLDGTRIHPETYEWARKMAVDALEIDESLGPAGALEQILEHPEKLKDLDLDAFAGELRRQGYGEKSQTLYDIRSELNGPYRDLRDAWQAPGGLALLSLLTHEPVDTFKELKRVLSGRVLRIVYAPPKAENRKQQPERDASGMWRCPTCYRGAFQDLNDVWRHLDLDCPGFPVGVRVQLDIGIQGFIPKRSLCSDENLKNPEDRVRPNQQIFCKVVSVDERRQTLVLTSRSADLNKSADKTDDYWDSERQRADEEADRNTRENRQRLATTNFVRRVISHPAFHNVAYRDAEKMLAKLEQGEAVIRPSSKSADRLTVTWKVADGIYQHIEIVERDKEHAFSLGRRLLIGDDEFEDLNEILARHIQPMAQAAREIITHKSYLVGVTAEQRDAIENKLAEEKSKSAARIPYTLTPMSNYPGRFVMSYLPRLKSKHEVMTVTSEGIRFRKRMFATLADVLNWFKIHWREPPPQPTSGQALHPSQHHQQHHNL